MVGIGKHTPGPYGVFADDRSIVIRTSDGVAPIARLYAAGGSDLDNAHLFAAAPDLLEVAQQLEESLTADGYESVLVAGLRAAIAKATGQ